MHDDGTGHARPAPSRSSAVWLALFLGLAVLHTWPLVTDIGGLSRNDNADAQLNEWIIAWVAHQLPRDPWHLFDANIFYPEPHTLAFSENLLLPSLMVAPLSWLGASPVVAYNVLLILGFALTGWTTWLLLSRWTGDVWAGMLAGCLATFNAHTLTRLPHVQAMHAEFLPLTLLALDRLLTRPDARQGVRVAAWFILQALSSLYVMVFTALSGVVALLVRPSDWIGERARRAIPLLAGTALLASGALGVVLYPYYRVSVDQGLTRPLSEVGLYAASAADYLSTAGRLHYGLWSHRFYSYGAASLFPGITAMALAAVAVGRGVAWSDSRARMLLGLGAAGLVLSFGTATPLYGWTYSALPLLHGIRNASRFGYMTLLAVAGLAGFGLATVRRASGGPRRLATALTVAAIVAVNLEAARLPMGYTPYSGLSPVYDVLAAQPNAVVVELPFPPASRVALNGPYVLASTRYWHPLVNGYSGFRPASYAAHAEALAGFPDARSIDMIDRLGVTHIVMHGRALREALAGSPWNDRFLLLAAVGEDRLYRVDAGAPR